MRKGRPERASAAGGFRRAPRGVRGLGVLPTVQPSRRGLPHGMSRSPGMIDDWLIIAKNRWQPSGMGRSENAPYAQQTEQGVDRGEDGLSDRAGKYPVEPPADAAHNDQEQGPSSRPACAGPTPAAQISGPARRSPGTETAAARGLRHSSRRRLAGGDRVLCWRLGLGYHRWVEPPLIR